MAIIYGWSTDPRGRLNLRTVKKSISSQQEASYGASFFGPFFLPDEYYPASDYI